MPAPLFHRKAGDDGVQELKLVHDPSRGSLILRVGSGRIELDSGDGLAVGLAPVEARLVKSERALQRAGQ